MEHLPLPYDASGLGPDPVPYVCKEEYDGGPFLTYPDRRKELDGARNKVEIIVRTGIDKVVSESIAELEAFIQTWLFFGLLTEVLGKLFIPSDYVVAAMPTPQDVTRSVQLLPLLESGTVGPRKLLNTCQLVPVVEKWINQIKLSNDTEDEKRTQSEHIAACLRTTSTTLQAVDPSAQADFNPWIRRSIASIGELLTEATIEAYKTVQIRIDNHFLPRNWQLFYEDPQSLIPFRENGLCSYEIQQIRSLLISAQTYHFLTLMRKNAQKGKHQRCTERECRENQNNGGRYVIKHRHDTCQCKNLEINPSEVINVLSLGSLPLLRIIPESDLNDVRVDVVKASPGLKYVALSHVWADGLGNPYANSLPKCQLQLLHELTFSFSTREGDEVLLWIDTLCCPVAPPEAKTMALNQMKTPYSDASHVLVLESSLRCIEALDLDPIEICLRIFTSRWMRRLWTLQEAALPQNLWFQFKDSVVEFRQMWSKLAKITNDEIGRRGIARDTMGLYRGLRQFFHAEEGDRGADLISVDQALQFRSVSVASDEPLLIASLLNLDASRLLNGPADSGMQRLWSLMSSTPGGIPKDVLFCRGSRLRQHGFRWAPASLLAPEGARDGVLRHPDIVDNKGFLTSDGLRVCLPAFPIRMAEVPKGLPKNPWNLFHQMDENSIFCRNAEGKWLILRNKYGLSNEQDISQPTLHSILRNASQSQTLLLASSLRFDGRSGTVNGLLVHDDGSHNGTPRVVSNMIVEMSLLGGTAETIFEATYQASRALLKDEITTIYANLAIENEKDQKNNPAYAKLEPLLGQKLLDLFASIKSQKILDAIKAEERSGTKSIFLGRTVYAYLGWYCELGSMLPSSTEWCVD